MDWYALQLRSNHERVVHAALQVQEIEDFDPVYTERHRWSDRTKVIPRHLFPGYLFARFDLGIRRSVLAVPGVLRLVGVGADPVAIPSTEIESIRLMMNAPKTVTPCTVVAGDSVTVARGPLTGATGVVLREKAGFRLVVSIEMLGRAAGVELDAGDLFVTSHA